MTDLSTCDRNELEVRLGSLLDSLDVKYKEIGPIIESIGRLREEVAIISQELDKRGPKKDVI